jgi:hypothetical protein
VSAAQATAATPSAAAVSKDPENEIAIAVEYFNFSRESDFLGFGQTSKALGKLKGSLPGIGLRWTPLAATSKNSFEFNGRSGELEASPSYSLGAFGSVSSKVEVDRTEFELGGLYYVGKTVNFIRYGIARAEEKLTNTLPDTSPANWAPNTGGIDSSNARRYRRSLSSLSGYVGLSFAFGSSSTSGSTTSLYGLKLDVDVQAGELQSNFLTSSGKEEKSGFAAVPHRATLYYKSVGNAGSFFAEAGYRGLYNFAQKGGLKGYDSGVFGRLGFSVSF